MPKTHALDADCVGVVESIVGWDRPTSTLNAMGRGCYRWTQLDRHGVPRGILTRSKRAKGIATGNLAKVDVPSSEEAERWTGRVTVRATASFNVTQGEVTIQGIVHRHCRLFQRADGSRMA